MLTTYTPTQAVNGYALGLRKPDHDSKILKLRWAHDRVPPTPDASDHLKGWGFEMGGNNRWGTCGPTSISNQRDMTTSFLTGREENAPLDAVIDLYRRSGSPNFDPNTGRGDFGVSMQQLCRACHEGGFNGRKALGYAQLADMTDPSIHAAIHAFGGVLFAVDLETAQSGQTNSGYWDYQKSPEWGGHAILAAAYDRGKGEIDVVTWQKRVRTTAAFRRFQLSEVWVVLWPELVESKKFFEAGVDLAQLASDYLALTGDTFPVPVPPPSPPVPPVPPVPPPPADDSFCLYPSAKQYRPSPGWSPLPR